MRDATDWEHDELPDYSDRGCRRRWCANSSHADAQASYTGDLCEDCIREAEREDAENPVCPVCELRESEHGDVFPCRIDGQGEDDSLLDR